MLLFSTHPQQPGIYRSKECVSGFNGIRYFRKVLYHPFKLESTEVGANGQSSGVSKTVCASLRFVLLRELQHEFVSPCIRPHYIVKTNLHRVVGETVSNSFVMRTLRRIKFGPNLFRPRHVPMVLYRGFPVFLFQTTVVSL